MQCVCLFRQRAKPPDMDEDLRAFYDFNSKHMEPWDGPAGIVLSDGRYAACSQQTVTVCVTRYVITKDKLITLASEVGIWNYAPDEVAEKAVLDRVNYWLLTLAKASCGNQARSTTILEPPPIP